MLGQTTFNITRKFVNVIFYLVILISIVTLVIRTYRLVEGGPDVANPSHQTPLSFDVMNFGSGSGEMPYRFSEEKRAALRQPPNQYQLLVGYRSPMGYYDYFLTLLYIAAAVYGIWQLRRIFYSISLEEPFAMANANRIRNIGLVLIASDVIKLLNYVIFDAMANKYFEGTELLTQIGNRIWLGLLLLALSIVYRRGVEIYSDNQLTI